MLVIRMQRIGRKGHAQFRVVVQDSRRTPTSGKIVAALGSFNPHTKVTTLDKDKASFYLEHGAQPSERVVRLLKSEGVKLPSWVSVPVATDRTLRNPDKLRKNRPADAEPVEEPVKQEAKAEPEEEVTAAEVAEDSAVEAEEAPVVEANAETTDEPKA